MMTRHVRRSVTARPRRFRPRLEALEARLALSLSDAPVAAPADTGAALGPDLSILSVDPADGSEVTSPPSTSTLAFDRPIDPTTLGLDSDFDLVRVNVDGSTTSIYYAPGVPTPTESLDASGTRLTIDFHQRLGAGRYQVVLTAASNLFALDGSAMSTIGSALVVSDFQVKAAGTGLADAIDLGAVGSDPAAVKGALDLADDPSAVALYKITLPAGHFWRLGAEVSANRDGGPLLSALSLFDGQGKPIAVNQSGRIDFPNDPYLFAGLSTGTYYVGVSGRGNLPGTAGGYDPSTSTPGSSSQSQAGGTFTLHLVADAEDQAPTLRQLTLDRADPNDPTPTGLTLSFSDAVRLGAGADAAWSVLNQGVKVVDASGKAWKVVASGYNEAEARVSYLFNDRLPSGRYTIELPPASTGGLADLAGRSYVAPGEPSGALGSFVVAAPPTKAAGDLGALSPDAASTGVTALDALAPGASATHRFVLTYQTIYAFTDRFDGGALSARVDGPSGSFALDPDGSGSIASSTLLPAGVYSITITAGASPSASRLTLASVGSLPESIVENGVGQGPALDLRLIAPTDLIPVPVAPSPDSSGGGGTPGGTSTGGSGGSSRAGGSSTSTSTASASFGSSSSTLFLTVLAGEFVGRPAPGQGSSLAASASTSDSESTSTGVAAVVAGQGGSTPSTRSGASDSDMEADSLEDGPLSATVVDRVWSSAAGVLMTGVVTPRRGPRRGPRPPRRHVAPAPASSTPAPAPAPPSQSPASDAAPAPAQTSTTAVRAEPSRASIVPEGGGPVEVASALAAAIAAAVATWGRRRMERTPAARTIKARR